MSALSYELRTGNYGPVTVNRFRQVIRVYLVGGRIITANCLTGLVRLAPTRAGIQNKNAIRRFLELADADRYEVELARGKILLTDKIRKKRIDVMENGRILLPTRCCFRLLMKAGINANVYNIQEWLEYHERDRQESAPAAEQREEVPL